MLRTRLLRDRADLDEQNASETLLPSYVGRGVVRRENDGCQAVTIPESEDAFSMPSLHVLLDQVDIAFDDERAVAWAGLLLAAMLG
jgi:hypothetical protein